MQITQPADGPDTLAWYNDGQSKYVLEGQVADWPDARDQYTLLDVQVEKLRPLEKELFQPVSGRLLVQAPVGGDWRYGDRIRLQGWLQTPSEDETFSYRAILARRGIYSILRCGACSACLPQSDPACARRTASGQGGLILTAIYALRQSALQTIYQLFPDPEAGLLAGILLGVESGIPENVQQAFKDTSTSHIIAISGFNFAIVASLFASFFGWLLGRWRGMLAAFTGIAVYALLAGAGAGVIRAAVMGSLSVFAVQLGRRQNGLNSLAFVAALMAVFAPAVLWDVSFQLSFMATLGLILYAGPLTQIFEAQVSRWMQPNLAQRLSQPVGEYFLFTLAAQLTTLPVMLYYFQRLSWVSLLANPLILPPQPAVMILGGAAVLLGMAWLPAGRLLAMVAWPFLAYTIRMVEVLARWQGTAMSVGRISLWMVAAFYLALLALTFWGASLRSRLGEPLQRVSSRLGWVVLLALATATVFVWQQALSAPDGRLHLTVLDVGSGDALLIRTPTGRFVLIDGGPSPNALSDGLGRRMPWSQRRLDYLLVAAASREQVGGLLPTLERFQPDNVLWSGPPSDDFSARLVQQALTKARISAQAAEAGQALDLGGGAKLQVLAVTARGAVLLLEMGRFRALLPVGLDAGSLEKLQNDVNQGPVTALLLTDSGSAELNPPGWIAHWQPQAVLLSVAAGDRNGRPEAQTLKALSGYSVLRTDQNGWIELSTDGQQLWVQEERR